MEILAVIGKILFAALLVDSGINHFRHKDANVAYTRSKGIALPELAVVATGIILVLAPIFYLFGLFETASLIAIAVFLLTASVTMHRYWSINDHNVRGQERLSFFKNMSLLGLVLVILSGM